MKVDNQQPKPRIFIYEFVWTEELIRHIIQLCEEKGIEICGWGVREKDIARLKGVWPDAPIFQAPMPADLSEINYKHDLLNNFTYDEEENITLLLDREAAYQNNMHSSQARYQVYAWVESMLQQTKPNWVLYPDVPHNVFSYLLYLRAQKLGAKVLIIRRALAPHLFTLSRKIEREFTYGDIENEKIELSKQTDDYLNELRHGSDTAPVYMKKQKSNTRPMMLVKRAFAKGFSLFTKKSILGANTYAKRIRLKKFYESMCVPKLDVTKPYIVLYLHLQPERSTIPEGGAFAQQWLMSQMLAAACAEAGWELYIKEHPSTFMAGPKFYRGNWFYEALNVLPNVSLVSLDVNSAYLLENAKAIATVTGTIGIEAITKGVPALFFGESPRIGCTGTFRIKKKEDLTAAIAAIEEGVEIKFEDIQKFYSVWERDPTCHNTGLERRANHGSFWVRGVPQTIMFSKMADIIVNETN